MKDILDKPTTHRVATAEAHLQAPPAVIERLRDNRLDKGNALELARAAANLAAKRTPDLIPLCHPLPLRRLDVDYAFDTDTVIVTVSVACHGPTGVEMEALTAASVAALTLYDMMKSHAGFDLAIEQVRLLQKSGGKSGDVSRA